MSNRFASLSLLSVFVLACSDPAAGVERAEVPEAPPAPEPPATTAPEAARESLVIDRTSSSIGFTGAKITASHDGSFSDFAGTIDLSPNDLGASAVRMTVQVASMSIEPARLREHLMTADFFDVAQFPTATFESRRIEPATGARIGEREATHRITGVFTMHGQSREITFPAIVEVTDAAVSAESEFAIDRRDFGLVYPGMPDDLIRDEVVLRFRVRAPRPVAAR